jgi:GNAT superfamily N-acetyltransferase
MTPTLRIGRAKATSEHLKAILGLIDEAREWLPSKGTNQWHRPWPDRGRRDARVNRALELGATWIVWEILCGKAILAATVTVTGKPNPAVWSPADFNLAERTVYAHRLITARRYAGWGLGAELLDWAGRRGRRKYGAQCIRIDVWTGNEALHGYYMKHGFEQRGTCKDNNYPSGVLLEKPIPKIPHLVTPQFVRSHEVPAVFSAAGPQDPPYAPYDLPDADPAYLIPETPSNVRLMRISEAPPDFAELTAPGLVAASASA